MLQDSSNFPKKIQNQPIEPQAYDKLAPSPGKILPLILQQEQIIEELEKQLNLHRKHAQRLKDSNVLRERQIDIVLEELKAQFVKNNLSDFIQNREQLSKNLPRNDDSMFERYTCENCASLKTNLDLVAKTLSDLEQKHTSVLAEFADLKCSEKECVEKVLESSKLVDQAIAEKAEINIQLSMAQSRSAQLSMELQSMISAHQNDLEQCFESAQLNYRTELESMQNQIKLYSSNEKDLIQTNQTLKHQNERLVVETVNLNSKIDVVEHNSKMKITTMESSLKNFTKQKEKLEKELVELKKQCVVDLEEKLEMKSDMNQANSHFRDEIQKLQSQLKSKTKECLEQKYFVENVQNELNKHKMQNFRLIEEIDATSANATNEMKDRIRVMELSNEKVKTELEQMIWKQNGIIASLREECKFLNDKLKRIYVDHRRTIRRVKNTTATFDI